MGKSGDKGTSDAVIVVMGIKMSLSGILALLEGGLMKIVPSLASLFPGLLLIPFPAMLGKGFNSNCVLSDGDWSEVKSLSILTVSGS